jgi:hypothetical protein
MNKLNSKSLAFSAFYGITIVLALALFKIVTVYGETQLKAAPKISGSYRINSPNLPACLQSDKLSLTIEQSGIYLFSILSLASAQAPEAKIILNGNFNEQQFLLTSQGKQLANCQSLITAKAGNWLKIQGRQQEKILSGQIAGAVIPGIVDFTAQLEEPELRQEPTH